MRTATDVPKIPLRKALLILARFPVPRLSLGQIGVLFWAGVVAGLGMSAQNQWAIDHPGRWAPLLGLLMALPYFAVTFAMLWCAVKFLGAKDPPEDVQGPVGPENDGVMIRVPPAVQNKHTRRF